MNTTLLFSHSDRRPAQLLLPFGLLDVRFAFISIPLEARTDCLRLTFINLMTTVTHYSRGDRQILDN